MPARSVRLAAFSLILAASACLVLLAGSRARAALSMHVKMLPSVDGDVDAVTMASNQLATVRITVANDTPADPIDSLGIDYGDGTTGLLARGSLVKLAPDSNDVTHWYVREPETMDEVVCTTRVWVFTDAGFRCDTSIAVRVVREGASIRPRLQVRASAVQSERMLGLRGCVVEIHDKGRGATLSGRMLPARHSIIVPPAQGMHVRTFGGE
jgi:hypothetical protein